MKIFNLLFCGFLVLSLNACSINQEGETANENTDDTPSETPDNNQDDKPDETPDQTQPSEPNLQNQIAFYVLVSGSSNSEYFAAYDVTVSSNTNYIYQIVPDISHLKKVTSNTSFSYASSSIVPKTENGQVFVLKTTGLESNDSHTLTKYDPVTSQQLLQKQFYSNPVSSTQHIAVVDNNYFFETYRSYRAFYGYVGGDFYKADLLNSDFSTYKTKLTETDEVSQLDASLTTLYDIHKIDDQLKIYSRKLTDGAISSTLGDFIMTNESSYENYEFDVDRDDKIYMARNVKGTTTIELWQIDFSQESPFTFLQYFDTSTIGSPSFVHFDVDNGYCMFANVGEGQIYVYDTHTQTERAYDLGLKSIRIEMLYIDESIDE